MNFLVYFMAISFVFSVNSQLSRHISTKQRNNLHPLRAGPVGPTRSPQRESFLQSLDSEPFTANRDQIQQGGQMPSLRPPPGLATRLNQARFRDFIALGRSLMRRRTVAFS